MRFGNVFYGAASSVVGFIGVLTFIIIFTATFAAVVHSIDRAVETLTQSDNI